MSNVKQYDNTFSRPQFLKIYYNTAAFHEYNSHHAFEHVLAICIEYTVSVAKH
jgi:hypothetical protein